MSNVMLSVFALIVAGLPGDDAVRSVPDISVATVFRDSRESFVLPLLERPDWLAPESGNSGYRSQIRGQSPGGVMGAPPGSSPFQPFQPGTDPVLPYLNDPAPTVISGINGPQPHRFGFTPIFDATYIAPSSAQGSGMGKLTVQEYDGALRHSSMLGADWIFTNTAQGGARLWNGPNTPDLPGAVYRAGWDFLLNSPQLGPWSAQFDFNPSVNADFQSTLHRESLNFDGSATAFYRVSPQLMLVLGVQYWDRVDKILIPNAGVVWNPTDQLELRLLFPKSRISYFLGTVGDGSHWIYANAEYHVDSYQIKVPGMSAQDQIQFSDWRFAVGLRSDHQWYDKYIEVGYVLDRQVKYLHSPSDFNLNDGLMARIGVRF